MDDILIPLLYYEKILPLILLPCGKALKVYAFETELIVPFVPYVDSI